MAKISSKDLTELVQAGILPQQTAQQILEYYQQKEGVTTNRLFVVFAILGALLVGLGIILIVAHNWDDYSRGTKTALSFLPLIIGQAACLYTMLKLNENIAWREASAAFLVAAVGASISLISQVYHIPGNLEGFLLTWMLLILPVIYLMRSTMAWLLYLVGITCYAFTNTYVFSYSSSNYIYWLMLLAVLPFYYHNLKRKSESNFVLFQNWALPVSVFLAFISVITVYSELLALIFSSFFGLCYLAGTMPYFEKRKAEFNAYKALGMIGTIGTLLVLSSKWYWQNLQRQHWEGVQVLSSPEGVAATITTVAGAALLLYKTQKLKAYHDWFQYVFIVFVFIFLTGFTTVILSAVAINLLVLAISIFFIRKGETENHLGILNFGLVVVAALVAFRFFDTDLTFIARGLLFLGVGAGFFVANYRLLKKRNTHHTNPQV
ncbi:MAG: DUF2157 domain-containing protein [Hymenobacteraceae bacterium]|nr:DUF2157 domain-containing protein [Hymenobacteraceae bacterium]MDX5395103.1 DUF2157 domain-containing protein [Hymenobacteraceae bacterium]MDX5511141.1 DUF2157 domain-containing protein [Hymenobacteraceae bacterium]